MGSEIIEVVERRRRWPVEVRLRILEEVLLRIPGKATSRSGAWRPPVPGHGDQCGAGVLEGTVEWVS